MLLTLYHSLVRWAFTNSIVQMRKLRLWERLRSLPEVTELKSWNRTLLRSDTRDCTLHLIGVSHLHVLILATRVKR